MPLSKARDRERKRLAKFQPNSNLKGKPTFQPNLLTKLEKAGLKLKGNAIVGIAKQVAHPYFVQPPIYNPAIHRPGDKVMMRSPYNRKLIETVIPELDADGNPVPNFP